MNPVSSLPGVAAGLPSSVTTPATSGPGDLPFSQLLTNALEDVNQQQQQVGVELQRLTNGESEHVHDLVVSAAKADLGLRMVLEVRDQLIASYQEIMRMQM
ncbi:MAG: flagellar hook-basal body complex protein FliE [Planctomycetaceae bacterium]